MNSITSSKPNPSLSPDVPQDRINDLPEKALTVLFGYLSQTERELNRIVCTKWNNFIKAHFPIELVINSTNFQRLFTCPRAQKVKLHSLSTEYLGSVAFAPSLRRLEVSGKVLTTNVLKLLRLCGGLEDLQLVSPKEVLGIATNNNGSGSPTLVLPNLTSLGLKVRADQEIFTTDEMILLNALSHVRYPRLEKIEIGVGFTWDDDGENDDDDDSEQPSGMVGFEENDDADVDDSTMDDSTIIGEPSETGGNDDGESNSMIRRVMRRIATRPYPNPSSSSPSSMPVMGDANSSASNGGTFTEATMSIPLPAITGNQGGHANSTATTITVPPPGNDNEGRPLQVDVSVGMTTRTSASANDEGDDDGSVMADSTISQLDRTGVVDFSTRLLTYRLQGILARVTSSSDFDGFLNDPHQGRTGMMGRYQGILTILNAQQQQQPQTLSLLPANNTDINTSGFFEIVKNNCEHLKSLVVKARHDFLLFGNIWSARPEVLSKIQFSEIEYCFGRSKSLCSEYVLLEVQRRLVSLRIHILNDLWDSVMMAVEKSKESLEELDVKVLALSEAPIDAAPLANCASLKTLHLFHFFKKDNLSQLPPSLNKLVLNGPITKEDMRSFAQRLVNLAQFDLILNYEPTEKIDVDLFRELVALPKIKRMVFIQTQMDVNGLLEYCRTTPGVKINVQGPRVLREPYTLGNSIQYVIVQVTGSREALDPSTRNKSSHVFRLPNLL